MPVDECDPHVEWDKDRECPLQGDAHEPWDEDKDLAGQGNVGNQQDNACNDVPAASEEHGRMFARRLLPLLGRFVE